MSIAIKAGGVAVAMMALTACASSTVPPVASTTAPVASDTPTASATPVSAATVAACKAYARVEPKLNDDIVSIGKADTPIFLISAVFSRDADLLETGTVTADGDLKSAIASAVAGFKSAKATTDAYKSGTLDLVPDLQVVYDTTGQIVDLCRVADPAGTYKPVGNVG